jgi:hypothetical protein
MITNIIPENEVTAYLKSRGWIKLSEIPGMLPEWSDPQNLSDKYITLWAVITQLVREQSK